MGWNKLRKLTKNTVIIKVENLEKFKDYTETITVDVIRKKSNKLETKTALSSCNYNIILVRILLYHYHIIRK